MRRPLLKLCGLHSEEDVKTAQRSEADVCGFVMAQSKRQVSLQKAAEWLDSHPLSGMKTAALFVNAPISEIERAVEVMSPDIIQCHGTETIREIYQIKQRTGRKVWKAFPHDNGTLQRMKDYAALVDAMVIDAKVKGKWGGTGHRFDWSHVPQYVTFGEENNIPVWIAGGITPENTRDLLPYSPQGIDVSSGIEKNGKKDEDLIKDLEKRLNDHAHYVSG